MKLTPKRAHALKWFRDNDNAKYWPIGISRSVITKLVEAGWLDQIKPEGGFGMVVHRITEVGRKALEDGQ